MSAPSDSLKKQSAILLRMIEEFMKASQAEGIKSDIFEANFTSSDTKYKVRIERNPDGDKEAS